VPVEIAFGQLLDDLCGRDHTDPMPPVAHDAGVEAIMRGLPC
jgi:hypothetical protein